MKLKRPRSWMQWLRRLCQTVCLCAFLWLLLSARFTGDAAPSPGLKFFFDLDPLVSLATVLSARDWAAGSVWALVTLIATILLGRVFCGWICPLGAVHTLASWFRPKPKGKHAPEVRGPWHRVKYGILIALLTMALFGVHWIGVFDPIPLLYRSVTTAVLPGVHGMIEEGSTEVFQADPHLGPLHATAVTEPIYRFSRDYIFRVARQAFAGGTLIAVFFILIVLLNFVRPRFWCRHICPLGALLGLFAQRPLLRLRNDKETCRNCGKCNRNCPAAAQPDQPGEWLPSECFSCWNCVASCKFEAVDFTVGSPFPRPAMGKLDYSRRATLAAGVGGMASLMALRVTPESRNQQPFPATLIRPPGAREERDFLQRCLQCGLCMRACPTNALQPAALEAGLEGIWTPMLKPKIGYCEFNCHLCGQVCPTEAIQPLPIEEKKQTRIGLATFDRNRCLPWAYGRECLVCEEHCPVPKKAIYLVPAEVRVRFGEVITVKQPYVDPDLCIGCGICEWSCVFQDEAAIHVTSANESRASKNQPILPGMSSGGDDPYGA